MPSSGSLRPQRSEVPSNTGLKLTVAAWQAGRRPQLNPVLYGL